MNQIKGLHHGADYNPDQWLDQYPDIIDEDFALMKEAHTNTFSLNIFGWTKLEPEEGQYNFGWLDQIMDRMAESGFLVTLTTPSGAKPVWLAHKYPETRKVDEQLRRRHFGHRHNHCWTSPVYRKKIAELNRRLAERYKDNPALWMWHISNEYGGDTFGSACFCELCQEKFRQWLQSKYKTIEALNHAWWSTFWSHTYYQWSEVEAPHALNDTESIHGLTIDWKRFTTENAVDFMKGEIQPLREITPNIPVTTNFMGTFEPLDYWQFAKEIDVASWDSYPMWHAAYNGSQQQNSTENGDDVELSHQVAFNHDLMRSYKDKSWILMESVPSSTNWWGFSKNKRKGMNTLSAIQAVAHGADGVLYFQFRKSRGGSEKFHGAIVDHVGHLNTRIGREVQDTGKLLETLGEVYGAQTNSQIAIIHDWSNRWAFEAAQGPRNDGKLDYVDECTRYYKALRNHQYAVDVVNSENSFEKYNMVIAPILYMLSESTAARLIAFVKQGGTLIFTYWSGIVNETDLCHLGGWPGLLQDVFGIWNEEVDALAPDETRAVLVNSAELGTSDVLNIHGEYSASLLWENIHLQGAQSIANFTEELFANQPAITMNSYGKGKAYYVGACVDDRLLGDLLPCIAKGAGAKSCVELNLPLGVFVNCRIKGGTHYYFWQNYTNKEKVIWLENEKQVSFQGSQKLKYFTISAYGVYITKSK